MAEKVIVVIPTYDERDNLEPIVGAALAVLPQAHVLIVDDASPDGTGRLADELADREPRLKVLHRAGKQGLGTAYREGFAVALREGYSHILQMDADFSHDPKDLARLLEAVRGGADLAVGSRYVEGGGTENWGIGRQILSRGGSLYARTILGVRIRDLTAGFKCWTAEALRRINVESVRSEGYGFQIEMKYRAAQAGLKIVEVPIIFADRRVGQSKMSRRIIVEALLGVWRLRLAK